MPVLPKEQLKSFNARLRGSQRHHFSGERIWWLSRLIVLPKFGARNIILLYAYINFMAIKFQHGDPLSYLEDVAGQLNLILEHLDEQRAGVYTCVASNNDESGRYSYFYFLKEIYRIININFF